ncbi:MAG: hypothetical protein SAJ12_20900 [Jaaginema sp. PMC 1079.18]|nr:hypothetical protein [Jaaginema sp. PMC 1080.18]MEC4853447.1 hypothetical protein [Jaaginema sp. PMC 1079.18]MEC4868452.1 hypothetical protein [Jaaginema sp. PMC 1078.18]
MTKLQRDRPRRSRQRNASKTASQSIQSEMREKAIALGLPQGETVLPERKVSPDRGDPTLVDDRPFAAAF